jgi:hypothetical protein
MKTREFSRSSLLLLASFCLFPASVFAIGDAQLAINNNGLTSWRLDSYSPAEANVGPLAVANPTLNLVIGKRYDITDPNFVAHPFQLIAIAKSGTSATDMILLSYGATVGTFESDPNVGWQDTGTSTATFTLTSALANAMSPDVNHVPGYRCGIHTTTMRGNINIKPAPVCGDSNHPFLPSDINHDCFVDLFDLALMTQNWLDCTSPDPNCGYLSWP